MFRHAVTTQRNNASFQIMQRGFRGRRVGVTEVTQMYIRTAPYGAAKFVILWKRGGTMIDAYRRDLVVSATHPTEDLLEAIIAEM